MSQGRLIAVVGPSGVGKDSVMAGLHAAMPAMHLVRRVITRAPELGGEDYDAVSVPTFDAMVGRDAFAVHWGAHGLFYGIPHAITDQLAAGTDCLANFSRKALGEAAQIFPRFLVLNITAKPETLAIRLAARGRETQDEIAKRLAQADKPLPSGLDVIHLSNDGALHDTIARGVALLQPESV
ncbi:ribose 1,5-bisphosphokinase [Aliiroseovarius halocynthiae]|uniref:Ribose 1,5-bisphosphate phosphokinase PhnN n=1 Tax=Aliiroseovarius halocynthiae TaxID=985055 RepID=A0A545SQ98_9RHOB|nr:phosphonate metabolism protein/1,5-bisphosphokinase (PRPP-forming) PhnN [Aliiroseovarius halocynthiae]TQV67155.1 phosphonate metabolism protein/1,5-bisphosphokinase (PRPP-forming) PhnN [Aliiroseovarius halocynthiae]SMR82115.1 ribose 1,5-bisphosphokinase [Aliiroseovarius halocynthiae]